MKPCRRSGLTARSIGNERLVHDPVTDAIHVLHAQAAIVWDLLDGSRTVRQIEDEIEARNKAGGPAVDGESTLTDLARKNLIDPPGFSVEKARIEEAMEERPLDPVPRIRMGIAHMREGRSDLALACLQRALELDPESVDALINLATVCFIRGDGGQAESLLRKALALRPENPVALNNLGNVLGRNGQDDEAAALYRRALELRPDYVEAWNNLGGYHERHGRNEQAVEQYRRALKVDPASASSLAPLMKILLAENRQDEAIQVMEEARAAKPDNIGFHDTLIGLYGSRGNMVAAARLYQDAMAREPHPDLSLFTNIARMQKPLIW